MMMKSLFLLSCVCLLQLSVAFQFDGPSDKSLTQRLSAQLRPAVSAGRYRLGLGAAKRRVTQEAPVMSPNSLGSGMMTKRGGGGRPPFLTLAEAPPKTLEARQHGNTVLECSASGNPAPVITWLKNGQPLNKDYFSLDYSEQRYSTFASDSMAETKSRVTLDCVTEDDAGLYECVASNQVKKMSVVTEVNVASFADTGCVPRHSHNVDIHPPRIYQWMGTYMQVMGSEAHLICRADGQHTTGWISPDMEVIVETNPKYRILSNGDLIIHDLSFTDMGMFKCLAANENGEDMQETFVYPHAPQ